MTTSLDQWLDRATRCLATDSAARVRTEIREHYESARAAALCGGVTPEEADRRALEALGDAEETNRQYRKALLTTAEEKALRQSAWEAQAFCVRGRARIYGIALPAVTLAACVMLFVTGHRGIARVAFAATIVMGLLTLAPTLPIYTRSRSRIVRLLKWAALIGLPALALGPEAWKYSWLFIAALAPAVSMEIQRMSIRRKLPISQWPKHLYL